MPDRNCKMDRNALGHGGATDVLPSNGHRFVYVANHGPEAQPDSTVSVIDTQRYAVVKTLTTGRGAHGVVVSDDGRRVFIANTFRGTVSVIDVAAQRVIETVLVGEGPGGITYRARTP